MEFSDLVKWVHPCAKIRTDAPEILVVYRLNGKKIFLFYMGHFARLKVVNSIFELIDFLDERI